TEELRKLLITGFPYAPFESVLKRLGWTRAQVGEALGLPERTLARRKQERKFQPLESDRVFRFLQVVAHAIETIGDDEKAGRWLTKPNRALMGKVPLQLLNTPIGASQVDEILGRIDHGLYSCCLFGGRRFQRSVDCCRPAPAMAEDRFGGDTGSGNAMA